jgi:hypothetical protein
LTFISARAWLARLRCKISKGVCERPYLGCDAAARCPYSLALTPPFFALARPVHLDGGATDHRAIEVRTDN